MYVCVCVFLYVYMCAYMRERDRKNEKEREREREMLSVSDELYSPTIYYASHAQNNKEFYAPKHR